MEPFHKLSELIFLLALFLILELITAFLFAYSSSVVITNATLHFASDVGISSQYAHTN